HSESAFLVVANLNVAVGGFKDDVEINPALFVVRAEGQRPLVFAKLLAFRREPFVLRDDHRGVADILRLDRFLLDLTMPRCFGPEVNAIDLAVSEPERAMVDMILLFRGDDIWFDRILTGHW